MERVNWVYADGGCRNNQSRENVGGWGVLLINGDSRTELKGAARNTTNNKMELTSCINALRAIKDKSIKTIVVMDSQYVIKGINEWMAGWIKKGWKSSQKKPVENKELWQEILELKGQFEDITFQHCYGHGDNEGNNRADALANEAMDGNLPEEQL